MRRKITNTIVFQNQMLKLFKFDVYVLHADQAFTKKRKGKVPYRKMNLATCVQFYIRCQRAVLGDSKLHLLRLYTWM